MYVSATIVFYTEVYCKLRNKRSVRHTELHAFVTVGRHNWTVWLQDTM